VNLWMMLSEYNNRNISGKSHPNSQSSISLLWNLLHRLSQDASHEVRAYIQDPSQLGQFIDLGPTGSTREKARLSNRLTFSRPPPTLIVG
jgi:hypothetical protein